MKSSSTPQPHLVTKDPKKKGLCICDKNCQMFKGFSICSHVIATAYVNGDLRSFLDNMTGVCGPNLTAIASHGMPSDTGQKGGVAKFKRNRKLPAIETRSVRPCLDKSQPSIVTTAVANTSSKQTPFNVPWTPLLVPTAPLSLNLDPHHAAVSHSTPSGLGLQNVFSDYSPSVTTIGASSQSQVFVGANVNFSLAGSSHQQSSQSKKPFILKFRNNSIKVCQSCRRNYDGPNDTMGLLVARAERRLVSNLATGTQFLGRESNSHYHLHMMCLKAADESFKGGDLAIPDDVKAKLNNLQKVYLATCFQVSF